MGIAVIAPASVGMSQGACSKVYLRGIISSAVICIGHCFIFRNKGRILNSHSLNV